MGVRKKEAANRRKEANKSIAFAKLNNCPTSPRKMRLVADMVRGTQVERALQLLKFSNKEASRKVEKLVLSGKLRMRMLVSKMLIFLLKRSKLILEQC